MTVNYRPFKGWNVGVGDVLLCHCWKTSKIGYNKIKNKVSLSQISGVLFAASHLWSAIYCTIILISNSHLFTERENKIINDTKKKNIYKIISTFSINLFK